MRYLQRLAELLFQTMPVSSAQLQLGAVREEHVEFAMRARRKLADAMEIDECGTVNPHKPGGSQLGFHFGDALAMQIDLFAGVQFHIHAGSLYPIDLRGLEDYHAAVDLDRPPPAVKRHAPIPGRSDAGVQHRQHSARHLAALSHLDLRDRPIQRFGEPFIAEGLQQVVQGMGFKRCQRVAIECRYEDVTGIGSLGISRRT